MKKSALSLFALLLISCENHDAAHAKAEEYYHHAFWANQYVYKTASANFSKISAPALKDEKNCAHDPAIEIQDKITELGKKIPEMDEKIIAIIQKNYTNEELDQINHFYTTTTMGRYLSSPEGLNEWTKLQTNSKNKAFTGNGRSIDVMVKILPEKDVKEYADFRNTPTGQKFFAEHAEMEKETTDAMMPFMKESADLAIYAAKINQACAKK